MISLANAVLLLAAVAWIVARQLRSVPVRPRALVVVPLVLGYVGLRGTSALGTHVFHDPVSDGLLALSGIAALSLGLWRGLSLRVWRAPDGTWWRRGTGTTLALWAAVLLVRGALVAIGYATGHPQPSGASVLLCCLALSFAAQNAVTLMRITDVAPAIFPREAPTS